MNSGYSTTPLFKKLGLKSGYIALLYNPPANYFELLNDLPEEIEFFEEFIQDADFIHIFLTLKKELESIPLQYKQALKKTGMMWISWPKGTSGIPTELSRDLIREHMLNLGLVDVKVSAIDKDWSGLKFVYRLKDR